MKDADASQDVVTVIRLVPLGSGDGSGAPAIVASFGRASLRSEGDAIFLVLRDELTRGRLKVGDIVHWIAQPLGVVWLAEHGAADAAGAGLDSAIVEGSRPCRESS